MRWEKTVIKTVLSLRAMIETEVCWEHFWKNIERHGDPFLNELITLYPYGLKLETVTSMLCIKLNDR